MSIGASITRTLIQRHRIALPLTMAFMVVAAIIFWVGREERIPSFLAMLMFMGLMAGAFYLMTVFVHSDSDVALPGSSYPSHYFTLPVRTADLVIWPVLAGILCVGGTTYLLSLAIQAGGYALDPVTAATIAMSIVTALQAVFWSPVGIPYSKLVLTILACAAIITISLSKFFFGITEAQRVSLFVAMIAGSVALTWVGVARARTGDSYAKQRERQAGRVRRRVAAKPFPSPQAAQFWYEWRQQGKTLPILTLVLFFLFALPLIGNDTLSPITGLIGVDGRTPTIPTFLLAYYPMMVVLIPIYGWAVGCGAKKTDLNRGDRTFHLFFGTRPLTDESMVWTKLKVAAVSSLAAWGVFFAATLPLLLMNGGRMEHGMKLEGVEPLYSLLPKYLTPALAFKLFCVVGLTFFWTWRSYVIGLWAELSGNLSLRYLQPLASVALYLVGASIINGSKHPFLWLAVFAGAGLTLKMGLSTYLALKLVATGVLAKTSLVRILVGYIVGVAVIGGLVASQWASWWAGQKGLDVDEIRIQLTVVVALAIPLYVPLARILAAVGALSSNRHK